MTAEDGRNSHLRRFTSLAAFVALAATTPADTTSSHTPATGGRNGDLPRSAGTCSVGRDVVIELRAGWRCDLTANEGRAYLLRVDQRDADVQITVLGTAGNAKLLTVDSPTRRAGPELAMLGPNVNGKHGVVISAANASARAPRATLRVEVIGNVKLVSGLSKLSRSAQVTSSPGKESAEQSNALLRAALVDFAAASAPAFEAECRIRIAANNYWIINDWGTAAATAQEAMQAFDSLAERTMWAQAAMIRGASLAELAGITRRRGGRAADSSAHTQFDEAEWLLKDAAVRFRAAGMKYDEAHALNNLGLALFYQGKYEDARAKYLAAASIFDALGEVASETLPLQNIAVIDYERGDYAEATRSFEQLLQKLDPDHDRSEYVAILNSLATSHYVVGNTDKALQILSEALRLTEDGSNVAGRARTLHALGRTYLIVGDRDRAEVYLDQALELRRTVASQDRRGLLISLVRKGDLLREQGEASRALELHLQALDQVVSAEERTRVLLAIGLDHMTAGSTAAAIEMYERALKLELPDEWPVRASVTGAYGYALAVSGKQEGRALLERAAKLHESSGDDELAARDFYLLATVERRAGQLQSALTNVRKAVALYEAQRLRAVNPDLRATYISSRTDAYELQAGLYMSLAERAQGAEKIRLQSAALMSSESLRQRAFRDFRQLAQSPHVGAEDPTAAQLIEIDHRLAAKRHRLSVLMEQTNPSPERVATLRREVESLRTEADVLQAKRSRVKTAETTSAAGLSLSDLQKVLPADTVVLTWLLGEDRSWLWCIARDAVAPLPLGPRQEIETATRTLRELWISPAGGDAIRQRELEASGVILGAAARQITGKRNITMIAEGPLRSIPIGALWLASEDGRRTERLVQSHAISYRPTLHHWNPAPSKPTDTEAGRRMLLVGDPIVFGATDQARSASTAMGRESLAAAQGELPRLPGSRREIDGIVRIAKGWQSEVLVGEDATKTAILAEPLGTFRVLHFATHARLDIRDPQLSAIVLSVPRPQAGTSQAALSLREIVGLQLRADTVVLSACEASLGKEYRGQLSLGLSEAFLLAGAEHVLGSLWRVSDAATEFYMQQFYEQYIRRGLTPDAAAQAAMRNMMRNPAYAHPYFWAAFVVLSA